MLASRTWSSRPSKPPRRKADDREEALPPTRGAAPADSQGAVRSVLRATGAGWPATVPRVPDQGKHPQALSSWVQGLGSWRSWSAAAGVALMDAMLHAALFVLIVALYSIWIPRWAAEEQGRKTDRRAAVG